MGAQACTWLPRCLGVRLGVRIKALGVHRVLSDLQIKNAKARDKAYKLSDSGGLYVYVSPKTAKNPADFRSFRQKYRFDQKEKVLTFGLWAAMSLAQARSLAAVARTDLAEGRDPSIVKRQAAVVAILNNATTLESVVVEFHERIMVDRRRALHSR